MDQKETPDYPGFPELRECLVIWDPRARKDPLELQESPAPPERTELTEPPALTASLDPREKWALKVKPGLEFLDLLETTALLGRTDRREKWACPAQLVSRAYPEKRGKWGLRVKPESKVPKGQKVPKELTVNAVPKVQRVLKVFLVSLEQRELVVRLVWTEPLAKTVKTESLVSQVLAV